MKSKMIVVGKCGCKVCHGGGQGCEKYPDRRIPIGTVIDHRDAYRLVWLGVAVPADDECKAMANMTEHEMKAAQWAHKRVAAGIHPDDYDKFDAGIIDGYYPDGTDRPGPNATETEGGLILNDELAD